MKGNFRVHEPICEYNPPVYYATRAIGKPGKLDGDLSKPFWQRGEWIDQFHDIEGDSLPRPFKYTRVKVLWDDEALYIGAELLDDEIWATVKNRDELIYIDNDFEVFLAPDDSTHRYYELEMNALNSVWDLLMEKPNRDCTRRIAGWDIQGLESAVKIDGELNNPAADNKGWSIELKLPWFSLRACRVDEHVPGHLAPDPGEVWRMNFSRVEWKVDVVDGRYVKRKDENGKDLPEYNWVWAPTGVIDIHMPEMFGYLCFTENGEERPLPLAEDEIRMALRQLYFKEHAFCCREGRFSDDAEALIGDLAKKFNISAYTTPSMFEGIAEVNGEIWHIRQDGWVWKGDEYEKRTY